MVDRMATSCYTNSMNTLVTISQAVWPFEGRKLVIDVTAEGVVFNDASTGQHIIPWDKVDDMEFLSEKFREMKVYEFRALVTALGVAYPYGRPRD
jgi:hypothetical protein